ncbi:nuclear transport factor 2 family protein [Nocardioides ochotonae]|uniref:nuclear transport factor 2 family protein n=1 Tax=Nocardioides ochotonae TaxID=2685869 RepID=UPI00140D3349
MTRAPEEAVRGLWRTLSARDYDGLAEWVTEDCVYMDMPLGPTLSARGPADIAKRLKVGWGELADYENHDGLLVADAAGNVMYEHSETWIFATGEVLTLPFATVHKVRDGRVCLWKDYWDYAAIMNQAPATWVESLAAADTSWVYDASALV